MKSSYTHRALRAILAAAVLSLGVMPIVAHAVGEQVNSLSVANAPLTPNNSGEARVRGVATPDVDIDLFASSNGVAFTKLVYLGNKPAAHSNPTADSGAGTPAGFFDTFANLTDFGTHDGTTSTIHLGAVAFSGPSSSPMTCGGPPPDVSCPPNMNVLPVIKNSGTTGDVYAPTLQVKSSPPSQWCHIASTDRAGSCGSTSFNGRAGVIPQCRTQTVVVTAQVGPVGTNPIPVNPPSPAPKATIPPVGPVGPVGPTPIATVPGQAIPQWPSQAPAAVKWFPCYAPLPNGYNTIAGNAFDNNSGSFGKSSEIKDVVIHITGPNKDVTYHQNTRKNTGAFFSTSLDIRDYPAGTYNISVIAYDAFGKASAEFKKSFQTMPDAP